jgi:cytidylate kinase
VVAAAAEACPLLVAIDGPAGVGKGTVARLLAARLGVPYFDTGAMYRAAALAVLEAGVDPADEVAAVAVAERARVQLAARDTPAGPVFEVQLDGRAVEDRIRTAEVSAAASTLSAYPAVRRRMVELQRSLGRRFGGVMEGRDIGTRVFPDTPHKFYLDAAPAVRAERRARQLARAGQPVSAAAVARELADRDHRDRTRRDSPLTCDGRYQRVDTSELTIEEVVERIEGAVRSAVR